MKRTLTYVALRMALLLSSSLLISGGWAKTKSDILSFVSRENGNFSLCLTDIRGEILRRITFDMPSIYGHTWSPDGRSFAYVSNVDGNNEIYVMDSKEKTRWRLTHHPSRDSEPTWAPNGRWIIFISNRQGKNDIYRIDVNGENVTQLTNQGECNELAWSPDSQWIAFTSSAPEGIGYSLFVMSVEGRRLRRLSDGIPLPGCTWSPDGKEIAFISQNAEGGMDIFSIDVDGKNLRQLTWSDQRVLIFEPVWSPSGKWIAYVLAQMPDELEPVPIAQIFANSVISVVSTVGNGQGELLEATRGLMGDNSIEWVPEGFFSVSPSRKKQTTFWGKLKQPDK